MTRLSSSPQETVGGSFPWKFRHFVCSLSQLPLARVGSVEWGAGGGGGLFSDGVSVLGGRSGGGAWGPSMWTVERG